MPYVDRTLAGSSIQERLNKFNKSLLDHLVFTLSDPVLIVTHDQEALSVVGRGHVASGVQHTDTQLLGVGVADLPLISDLLRHKVFKSVSWNILG